MEKSALNFVKDLIKEQITKINMCNDDGYIYHIEGLINNEDFAQVVIYTMGTDYFRDLKIEFRGDPKDFLLKNLQDILTQINIKLNDE